MRAEIITVGTELLLGRTPDSNVQTISRELSGIGVDVFFHTTVDDNQTRIAEAITVGLKRNDAVVITGGLGPTHDDLTRQAIAQATGRELYHNEQAEKAIRRWFEARHRPMAESNLLQALMPAGAKSIPNELGTACGIELEVEGGLIFALPGVPHEMHEMLRGYLLPRLAPESGGNPLVFRYLNVAGIGESDLATKISAVVASSESAGQPVVTLLSSPGEVSIQISARGNDEEAALRVIEPVETELRRLLGDLVYGVDDQTLEQVVADMALDREWTIGVAESFTGGAVVSRLVAVPGASLFLKAGYVTYSPDRKIADIDVPREVLERHGAVSPQTAAAMAEGVRRRSGADIGLSTTGEAGPKPDEEPVGTMFIGVSGDGGTEVREFAATGARQQIRLWGCQAALNMLRLWMLRRGRD
ncbi:MAG: competence/damage-inducible protein A [Actinomycetota bacterium]|nr:competence/damage-inducible protein A [Actinomycetota bacterium]